MSILEILGLLFLIVLLVGGYFAWKLYRAATAYKRTEFVKAMSALPELDLRLETSTKPDWVSLDQLDFQEKYLRDKGADHVGYFRHNSDGVELRVSLWNYKQRAVAALYEAELELNPGQAAFFYDLVARLKNGSICVSSNADAALDSRPSNHKLYLSQAPSVTKFFRTLRSNAPEGAEFIKIKDAKEFFHEVYTDTTEWAWREEQLRSDRTQQALVALKIKPSEELLQQLIELGHRNTVDVYTEKARKRFARHSSMNLERWESIRDELVFVHQKMKLQDLRDAIWDLSDQLSEEQEDILDKLEAKEVTKQSYDALNVFKSLLSKLDIRARRVATMSSPIQSEVYLPRSLKM